MTTTSGAAPRPAWMQRVVAAVAADEIWHPLLQVPAEGGRESAVLMLFGPGGRGDDVVLTERAADMRSHAGQVSFPGGSFDPADGNSAATAALREAAEEVGLARDGVDVVAELPRVFLRHTGYVVTPVLAWWPEPQPLGVVDPVEVARVVRAPVADLVDPARRFTVTHPSGYAGPGFDVEGLFVWGFTAMLLDALLGLAGLAGDWDPRVRQPLPDRFLQPERGRTS